MRVIELVIDGFKSYAVRTVISGWDDRFNAITGLNGSGKSNILDAICFVLGITNMSTVRAQNIQDLIYKRGQAGVTKASVTIVFDNTNKSKSPIGFEEYPQISVTRQIVMGGTTKYLINGHRAQQQTVQNLFQSVGLNVNNPNFLIMQGRITKVLNMKAAEVLAMIEEAAGTRMFEERRDRALKTMAKKDLKLASIQELLREEVEPKLEKLRGEKRAFLDFQQAQTDVERLTRVVAAYDWWTGTRKRAELEAEVTQQSTTKKSMADRRTRITNELAALEEEISRVKAIIDDELKRGGMGGLEEQARRASHDAVRVSTTVELKKKGLDESEAKAAAVDNRVAEATTRVDERRREVEAVETEWAAIDAQRKDLEKEVEEREELLQTAMTGVAEKGGDGMGFEGRVNAAKQRVGDVAAAGEQGRRRMAMLAERRANDKAKITKAEAEVRRLKTERDRLSRELVRLEADLGDDGNESELRAEEASLHQERRSLMSKREELRASAGGIDFAFADPEPGFDRSRVKGVLAKLFEVGALDKVGTAVEVCAGGRLWNVVVDSADTGAALLEKGQLVRRVTIIPLDKISATVAGRDRVAAAKSLAPGKVELALDLVKYRSEMKPAMAFVFGGTLVADDGETAKRVTFDPSVKLRSVTIDGDVYDPAGTLSGGSRQRQNRVLDSVAEIVRIEARLVAIDARLAEVRDLLSRIEQKKDVRRAVEVKRAEVEMADQQIASGPAATVLQAAAETEAEIARLTEESEQRREEHDKAEADLAQAERELAAFGRDRNGTLAELQKRVAVLKDRLQRANRDVIQPAEERRREAVAELEVAEAELAAATDEAAAERAGLEALRTEIAALVEEESRARTAATEAEERLAEERDRVAGHADDLAGLETTRRTKNKEKADAELAIKHAEIATERAAKDMGGLSSRISNLESEHEWIAAEKEAFGKPGRYSFGDGHATMSASRAQLQSVQGRFTAMRRRINPKVMNMIDSVEKKESALKGMMRIVIRDKRKIEDTIKTLDEYKRDALTRTWTTVNRDFGAIFGEVLPGSFAKLEPVAKGQADADNDTETADPGADKPTSPTNVDLSAGLAIRVRLGTIWKSSLAELSGGQRSLIALSLILALLQSKPAPMYILDEVDAALDLSHTQNIGTLIRTRFGGAQFIVVSLKDGMWANANRVFRTTFVGGTSVVRVEGGR